MASTTLSFNLSASAVQMASGINAGVVELQKLGYAAKKTQQDVATLKTLAISRAFIGSIQAIASAVSQANTLLSGFVDESVSIGEEASKANVIFGESAQAVQQFASSASGIGLSRKAALEATASFGNLFTAIGLSQQQAVDFSLTMTRLATDLASFNNTSVEDAALAISAALRGEAEPIRRYGVLLNDATLRQVAFAQGLRVTGNALDPAVKAQAAYYAILRQTTTAQGDFERTSAGIANQQRILAAEWNNVRAAIGEGLQPAYAAFVAGLRDSLPAIQQAGQQLTAFLKQVDFRGVVNLGVASVQALARSFSIFAAVAGPVISNIMPLAVLYVASIQREAIKTGLQSFARYAALAGPALRSLAAGGYAASASLAALKVAIRGVLVSTGIGAVAVAVGLAADAALTWALRTGSAAEQIAVSIENPADALAAYNAAVVAATGNTQEFGAKAKAALQVPSLNVAEFAQSSLSQAESAVKQLAQELGGLSRVPSDVLDEFGRLTELAQTANRDTRFQAFALQEVDRAARALTNSVRTLTDARGRDADAAREAAAAARRAADESRQRVAELANAGLSDAEKARLQLNKDLLAIATEQRAAEAALAAAKQAGDARSIADAKERLRLAQAAAAQAKAEDRERQLQALGVDANLLKPADTIANQFKAVREAFDRRLIDGGEAQQALRNLAAEGIRIRQEIAAELSRPAAQALEVNDIRTAQGVSQFLAFGREDPAIAQRREQLQKLTEIKNELRAIGVRPVDILGA